MATINDIARKTGLSVGTVSRYLNGEKIKEKNMILIDAAVKELGYRMNVLARSMKTGKSMTVAVIIPEIFNLFSMRVIKAVEKESAKKGYHVLIAGCERDTEQIYKRIELMQQRMIDGYILMPTEACKAAKVKEIIGETPAVIIDRYMDEKIFDSVTVDNENDVYKKIKETIENGAKKIGYIEGPEKTSTSIQRKEGFIKAMSETAATESYFVACRAFSIEEGMRAIEDLKKYDLDVVFASNYDITMGALLANENSNLRIIGVDKIELAEKLENVYEYIPQPIEKMGKNAARLLLKRLEGDNSSIVDLII